jgi:hypothetical protein
MSFAFFTAEYAGPVEIGSILQSHGTGIADKDRQARSGRVKEKSKKILIGLKERRGKKSESKK